MIQFPVYELLKDVLAERRQPGSHVSSQPSVVLPPVDLITASVVSKLVASSISYPHEVIRARLQVCSHPDSAPCCPFVIPTKGRRGEVGLLQCSDIAVVRWYCVCGVM